MAKTIMVSNNLSGTYDYQLAHVKFLNTSGNEAAVENGAAVVLGEYFNNEFRKATAPTANRHWHLHHWRRCDGQEEL